MILRRSCKFCLYINTKDPKEITVALKEGNKVVDSLTDYNQFGSQVLLPLIVKLLEKHSLDFEDLKGVEVETGPGSFTGLRVGASVAQALGFALDIPVNREVGKNIKLRYT
ncbi:MAG: tRNA (adenosine(37)-N6)-threonylcarbamoyltransferase complex dimerization subunit type 1 TsaB [Patescibacteria group bacterium]|nr:tRNA (adenosine(37)-N6)-threonylcarbamoyltransferase complex dimerization subunit type 1 TsaB [Patescibacteria group bacterium]